MIHDLPGLLRTRTIGWTPICRLHLSPTFEQVRQTLARLTLALDRAGVQAGDLGIVELVMAEVLNNLTEHAFLGRANGAIRLRAEHDGARLRILLRDNGSPLPGARLPAGVCPSADGLVEDLPEGGFGWHLIRSLTSDLAYRSGAGWNELRVVIPLGANLSRDG